MVMRMHSIFVFIFLFLLPSVSASNEGAGALLGILTIPIDFIIWTLLFWAVLATVHRFKKGAEDRETRLWEILFFTFFFLSIIIGILLDVSFAIAIVGLLIFGLYRITGGRKYLPQSRYSTPLFIALTCTLIIFTLWGAYSGYLEKRIDLAENCDNLPNHLTTPYFTSTSVVYYGRDARNRCLMQEAFKKKDASICNKLGRTYAYSGNTKSTCEMILQS